MFNSQTPFPMKNHEVSTRANIITRRTYNRPLDEAGSIFETWEATVERAVGHQEWLWVRARGGVPLDDACQAELSELKSLMLDRKSMLSGRTMWLGGTEVSKKREASQFNCAFTNVETVYDVVDVLWLLLQGCGVGMKPIVGSLTGFKTPIEKFTVIRSERTDKGGVENNQEILDVENSTWTLSIGDSSESWAKAIGKIMAMKHSVKEVILDFSQIRPAGMRLSQYGWISSGDENISKAFTAICQIMNRKAGSLLKKIDIMDIMNWLGTSLSSRRSAQIIFVDSTDDEVEEFMMAKQDMYTRGLNHREQSNNTVMYWSKPTLEEILNNLQIMVEAGGSEPGFCNAAEAKRRAPWFAGANPCFEILLANKSFCNLTENNLARFKGDTVGLHRATRIMARANYRQTCVNLKDGILQEAWHLNNDFLRLCGVGLTGVAMCPELSHYDYEQLNRVATAAAYSMADELGMPRPKNVTCIKPSGSLSKIMDCTEGVHLPLGKYVINRVIFSKSDPLVKICTDAGYEVMNHPTVSDQVLIALPVEYDGVKFTKFIRDGEVIHINVESAVKQLERYKMLQGSWSQQNTSVTISYDVNELEDIAKWFYDNWDDYVGVSFIFRNDPSKTAAMLGYAYLPQTVVSEREYNEYVAKLKPIDLEASNSLEQYSDDGCSNGFCPTR